MSGKCQTRAFLGLDRRPKTFSELATSVLEQEVKQRGADSDSLELRSDEQEYPELAPDRRILPEASDGHDLVGLRNWTTYRSSTASSMAASSQLRRVSAETG